MLGRRSVRISDIGIGALSMGPARQGAGPMPSMNRAPDTRQLPSIRCRSPGSKHPHDLGVGDSFTQPIVRHRPPRRARSPAVGQRAAATDSTPKAIDRSIDTLPTRAGLRNSGMGIEVIAERRMGILETRRRSASPLIEGAVGSADLKRETTARFSWRSPLSGSVATISS